MGRAVPPTVSALSPSSFPLQHSLPPGTSPSRERCNPSRSRTRAPRKRRRIPKTLPSIFPASVKKSIGARWNNEELRNRFYVLKKNIRNNSKRNTSKRNTSKRNTSKRNTSKRNTYHEQEASAKTKTKKRIEYRNSRDQLLDRYGR